MHHTQTFEELACSIKKKKTLKKHTTGADVTNHQIKDSAPIELFHYFMV